MLRKVSMVVFMLVLCLVVAAPALADGGGPPPRGDDGGRVRKVVYVTSQELYYDTIVGPALPNHGKFQQLFPPGTNPVWPLGDTLSTEFGPGDPGYLGGRWVVGPDYFSCPLLGPGRSEP